MILSFSFDSGISDITFFVEISSMISKWKSYLIFSLSTFYSQKARAWNRKSCISVTLLYLKLCTFVMKHLCSCQSLCEVVTDFTCVFSNFDLGLTRGSIIPLYRCSTRFAVSRGGFLFVSVDQRLLCYLYDVNPLKQYHTPLCVPKDLQYYI